MIAVVDYGAGNVRSVLKALTFLGHDAVLTADPQRIGAADQVLFPGQGHFGQAMARLRAEGLDEVLRRVVADGTPFVGICLGLQLLFEGSEEAPGVAGLGLLPGRCLRFPDTVKVPQIGWNAVDVPCEGSPMDGAHGEHFYFVHSYHAVASDAADVAATAGHGVTFTAAVHRANVFAAQFHPEKSGAAGLELLRRCLEPQRWAAGPGAPC